MQFAVIHSQKPNKLTKHYTLNNDGSLQKEVNGQIWKGSVTVQSISCMADFAELLLTLRTNEALVFGVPNGLNTAELVTRAVYDELELTQKTGIVARTKENFSYPKGPGIFMLDVDARVDGTIPTPDEFISLLDQYLPEATNTPKLIFPSASSHIYRIATGEDLTGLSGFRVYLPVDSAEEIPRVARTLNARLKAGGDGYASITKNGRVRIKSSIDMAVYTSCHLDFAAGASTGDGLEQRRGTPRLINQFGPILEMKAVELDETDEKRAKKAELKLREAAATEAARVAETWRFSQIEKITASGVTAQDAAKAVTRAEQGVLAGSFILSVSASSTAQIQKISVSTILANTEKYDGWQTRDPIEPDYDGGRLVGKLYIKGRKPQLHSFARGERTYALLADVGSVAPDYDTILIREGETSQAVDETTAAMASTGRFYDMGTALTEIVDGKPVTFTVDQLSYTLGHLTDFSKVARVGKSTQIHRCDPPMTLCRQVLNQHSRIFPKLDACVDRPQPRADGSVIASPGYDSATRLFLSRGLEAFPSFIENPREADIKKAIATCFAPFEGFKLTETGKTAILSAVLTAVIRPSLDLAPIILVRSPDIGAGKTLLTTALAVIAEGRIPSTQTMPDSNAEMGKRLLSLLLAGTSVIMLDNADGTLRSKKLASFATSAMWSDRELGKSSMRHELPNRALMLANGRNAVTADGWSRRVIPIEIEPAGRDRMQKTYDFSPERLAAAMRDEIIGAALTLIAAVPKDYKPMQSVASYHNWDHLVRRTVAWVSRIDPGLIDPIEMFVTEIANDLEQDGRRGLLEFLSSLIEKGMPENFFATDIREQVNKMGNERILEELLNTVSASDTNLTPRSIGTILSLIRDQDVYGLCLKGASRRGRILWRIEGHAHLQFSDAKLRGRAAMVADHPQKSRART